MRQNMTVEPTLDETVLKSWVGNTQSVTDTLDPKQARLMEAAMDRPMSLKAGDELPPCWQWIYFLDAAPMSGLGRDGHAALGEFLPPVALPRRMWAGGRLKFEKPIYLGEIIEKRSTITNITMKSGKSGQLCFVTVRHDVLGEDGGLRLSEEQDLVYRDEAPANAPAPAPVLCPPNSVSQKEISPSPVQLFRYSALTFNSHRIHYDRSYCTDVESYPGLIYHGPLSATVLADLAIKTHKGKRLKSFDFRAAAPIFDTAPFTLHHDGLETFWTQTPAGGLAMKAVARFT